MCDYADDDIIVETSCLCFMFCSVFLLYFKLQGKESENDFGSLFPMGNKHLHTHLIQPTDRDILYEEKQLLALCRMSILFSGYSS